jgi:hypothetical protein
MPFLIQLASVNKKFLAYDFLTDSGLKNTAEKSGHTEQALFGFLKAGENPLIYGISMIILSVLSLAGIVFFGLMLYGGWLWMTAQGNEEQTAKAKGIIISGTIGLVIILAAFAISYLIAMTISPATLK